MVNIFLADNHYIVRRGLRELLQEHEGWRICGEATNGRDAVRMALQLRPDVVVVDLLLRELNGVETARQILRDWPRAEILVFADHIPYELLTETLTVGIRGFVLKTEDGQHIVEAVQTLANHKPFFGGNIPETLLDVYLKRSTRSRKLSEMSILTKQERKIVQMITVARSNIDVARELGISVKTVETHRATAMRKLGINSLVHLVHYAVRNQLVEVGQLAK